MSVYKAKKTVTIITHRKICIPLYLHTRKKRLPQKKIQINIPKNLIERIIHHLVPKIKIESRGRGESNPSLARGGCFRRNCFSGRKCQRWKWTLWKMKSRCRLPAPPRGTRRGLKSRRWGEEGDLAYISAGREVVFVLWLLGKIYFFSCFSFLFVTRLRKILLRLWFYSCWGFLNVIVVYFLIRSPCSKGLFRKAITSAIILFRCTFLYEPRLDINLCPRASPRLSVKGKTTLLQNVLHLLQLLFLALNSWSRPLQGKGISFSQEKIILPIQQIKWRSLIQIDLVMMEHLRNILILVLNKQY